MNKKIIIGIVVVLVIILLLFLYSKKSIRNFDMNTAEGVCDYVASNPPDYCSNYECRARDNNDYWNVFYRCPGPENFPMGQGYAIEVNKSTGKINIIGLTN